MCEKYGNHSLNLECDIPLLMLFLLIKSRSLGLVHMQGEGIAWAHDCEEAEVTGSRFRSFLPLMVYRID